MVIPENWIVWIIVGLVAGYLASLVTRGRSMGCLGDIAIGLLGAVIGGWIFSALGISIGTGIVNAVITAFAGAVVLLAIGNVFGGRRRY